MKITDRVDEYRIPRRRALTNRRNCVIIYRVIIYSTFIFPRKIYSKGVRFTHSGFTGYYKLNRKKIDVISMCPALVVKLFNPSAVNILYLLDNFYREFSREIPVSISVMHFNINCHTRKYILYILKIIKIISYDYQTFFQLRIKNFFT